MIERAGKKKMLIFSGSSNPELADKVAKELGTELAEVDKTQFANGEIYIRLQESVRGADCFVSTFQILPALRIPFSYSFFNKPDDSSNLNNFINAILIIFT